MENLPPEIIEFILKNSILDIKDIVNFSLTCTEFKDIVYSNLSLWRVKYFQCWPRTDPSIYVKNWHNECILRKNFEKNVYCLLSFMSSKFYHTQMKNINDAELDFVNDLLNSHPYGYFYLKDCLLTINLLPVTLSLTHKYYGSILLKFINKKYYTQVWNDLLNLRNKEQILEKGAIFVSNWCQENGIDILPSVTNHLNQLANLVKQHLLQHHKDHPLKNISQDTFLMWEKENLPGNMFEPNFCKLIIESINYVLFEQFNYCIAYDLNYLDKRKGGIDYAIIDKRATPLMFAVIYESVARRVGVKIEILDFLDHCLLKWKENYMCENTVSHYINMNNKGIFKTARCPRSYGKNLTITPCDMFQIAQRVAFNTYPRERENNYLLVRDVLELVLVIMPFSLEWYQELSRSYMSHDMDVRKLLSKLLAIRPGMTEEEWRLFQPLFHSLEVYQKTWQREHINIKSTIPKFRTKEVKYAVGMIVRDKRFDNTGIIYGWDLICETSQKNHNASPQPFYKVLGGNNSDQYVAQENLQILHSPPFISHPFLGRFFEEYCFSYFKPNKELRDEYPQDEAVLIRILKKDRIQNINNTFVKNL